ncbi:MAG: SIR2 family protein [Bacteroidales bacterium]|nr:SIR2 family protein [Bacteroidales bacterium]
MPVEIIKDLSLDQISKWIDNEKCVLVLGPDLAFDFQKPLLRELSQHLHSKQIEFKFDETEELFASNIGFDPDFFTEVSTFFDGLKGNGIHKKIAEIPFNMIISFSPDLLLKQAFDNQNFDYTFEFYNRTVNPNPILNLTKEKPLLYNFLGSCNEFNSLVFCFKDVFNYLSAILGNFRLDENFRYKLHSAHSILFLGFKFDKWYFKLFLEMLNLGDKAKKHASLKEIELLASEDEKQNMLIDFCKNEFRIEFIQQPGIEIIDLLHQKYKQNNGLRKPKAPPVTGSGITVIGNGNTIINGIKDSEIDISPSS